MMQGFTWTRTARALTRPAPAFEIDRLIRSRPPGTPKIGMRRYRVRALVSFLSVPVFSKEDVGGACVTVEELVSESSRITVLQLSGGSWPDRLRGFNRFGMTQEAIREKGSGILESAYFSFMTASDEKNVDDARKAFADRSTSMTITITHGIANKTGYSSALDHLNVAAGLTWPDCPRLIEEIRGRVSRPSAVEAATDDVSPTFLYAVRKMLIEGVESAQCVFVHNARLYRLRTKISRTIGLTAMSGWIAECGSRHETAFGVWLDPRDATQLPTRIEFRPKSFLSLVFEHDPSLTGPAFQFLLSQEQG